jgi:hypothetical protein
MIADAFVRFVLPNGVNAVMWDDVVELCRPAILAPCPSSPQRSEARNAGRDWATGTARLAADALSFRATTCLVVSPTTHATEAAAADAPSGRPSGSGHSVVETVKEASPCYHADAQHADSALAAKKSDADEAAADDGVSRTHARTTLRPAAVCEGADGERGWDGTFDTSNLLVSNAAASSPHAQVPKCQYLPGVDGHTRPLGMFSATTPGHGGAHPAASLPHQSVPHASLHIAPETIASELSSLILSVISDGENEADGRLATALQRAFEAASMALRAGLCCHSMSLTPPGYPTCSSSCCQHALGTRQPRQFSSVQEQSRPESETHDCTSASGQMVSNRPGYRCSYAVDPVACCVMQQQMPSQRTAAAAGTRTAGDDLAPSQQLWICKSMDKTANTDAAATVSAPCGDIDHITVDAAVQVHMITAAAHSLLSHFQPKSTTLLGNSINDWLEL